GRLNTQPARTSRFSDGDIFMIGIAYLPNRGHAVVRNFAGFARRQLYQCVVAFFRHQLRRASGRAHHLRAFAGLQLDVVDGCAWRNILQGKRIAYQNVGLWAADNLLSDFQAIRLNDVALFTVCIRQQRNARRAVWIVFNGNHGRRNAGFVALKVHNAQLALVSAAAVPAGNVARVAASAGPLLRLDQLLVRLVRRDVVVDDGRAIAQRLGRRSVSFNRHKNSLTQNQVVGRRSLVVGQRPTTYSQRQFLQILRVLRHFFAGLQPHISFLPVRAIPGELAATPLFARIVRRANGLYFYLEDPLHRFIDFRLSRLGSDLKDQRVLVFLDGQALFGDDRLANDLISRFHYATSAAFSCRARLRGARLAFLPPSPSPAEAFRLRLVTEFCNDTCSFSSAGCAKIAWL